MIYMIVIVTNPNFIKGQFGQLESIIVDLGQFWVNWVLSGSSRDKNWDKQGQSGTNGDNLGQTRTK